jgi:hypothetical protein
MPNPHSYRNLYPNRVNKPKQEAKKVAAPSNSNFVQKDPIQLATYSYLCRNHVLYIYMPDGSHAAVWLNEKKSAFVGNSPCKLINLQLLCSWLTTGGIKNVWSTRSENNE